MTYLKQYAINILIVKNKITTQHNILILSKSCIRIQDFDKIKMLCCVVILFFTIKMFIAYCFRYVIANVMKHAFV
jgi:hypothetical protein